LQISCKMYIHTLQCMHCIYGCSQPCLILLTSCILITCNNYITTRINLVTNQWLLCNNVWPWVTHMIMHMYTFPPPNIYDISTCLQLICNYISIKKLKFGQETFKQMTHGSISIYLFQTINDFICLCLLSKKFKMIFFLNLFIQTFRVFISLLVMQFSYHVL